MTCQLEKASKHTRVDLLGRSDDLTCPSKRNAGQAPICQAKILSRSRIRIRVASISTPMADSGTTTPGRLDHKKENYEDAKSLELSSTTRPTKARQRAKHQYTPIPWSTQQLLRSSFQHSTPGTVLDSNGSCEISPKWRCRLHARLTFSTPRLGPQRDGVPKQQSTEIFNSGAY